MSISGENITRREFVRKTADASAAVFAGTQFLGRATAAAGQKSMVVLVRDPHVMNSAGTINRKILGEMLDEGVTSLTRQRSARAAWESLIHPRDTVGIKSNVWRPLPTPGELESALVSRLLTAGVDRTQISVDDRGVRRNLVFQQASALINVRPMRTHYWSGVGGCLKNYITFAQSPPRFHSDSCASIGSIWLRANLRERTRLNILVMLTPVFYGKGPHHYDSRYTWPYSGILLSTDPVAIDSVGLRILEAYRKEHFDKPTPLRPVAKHVGLAETRFGVGFANPEKIGILKRGWWPGALV